MLLDYTCFHAQTFHQTDEGNLTGRARSRIHYYTARRLYISFSSINLECPLLSKYPQHYLLTRKVPGYHKTIQVLLQWLAQFAPWRMYYADNSYILHIYLHIQNMYTSTWVQSVFTPHPCITMMGTVVWVVAPALHKCLLTSLTAYTSEIDWAGSSTKFTASDVWISIWCGDIHRDANNL